MEVQYIFSVLCNEEIEFKIEFKSIFGNTISDTIPFE